MKRWRIAVVLAATVFAGCGLTVEDGRAVKTMEAEGWSDVTVRNTHKISPHWFGGCSRDDAAAFEVAGLNPAGKPSSATVCCGWLVKSCTIRH